MPEDVRRLIDFDSVSIQKGMKKGMQEGIQKGVREGMRKGMLKAIEVGLKFRFGGSGFEAIESGRDLEEIKALLAKRVR